MTKIRVLQYNILADGLSRDGFVCSDVLTTIDGETHTISKFLATIRNANGSEALNEITNLYDTIENNRIYEECLDWPNRWQKIMDLIQKYEPDILVFQEIDHYADALSDMGRLGYSSSYRNNTEPYFPLWTDPNANDETYLSILSEQHYAFIPKLNSKARKFALKSGTVNPDNDGCAIFWKSDRFTLSDIQFCQFYKYESDKRDEDGAMAVVLSDLHNQNQKLCVITSHLPSGQTPERELERLEILSDSDRGVFRKFIQRMMNQYSRTIIALDANSDPDETYKYANCSNEHDGYNVWKAFHDIPNLRSVWDSYFDLGIQSGSNRSKPITVNKIRGPRSCQPTKIGVHSYELIDHIFYSGFDMEYFAFPIISFPSQDESLRNLIPNRTEPSDHYPVIVDLAMA